MYRYSDNTRETIIDLIRKFSDKINLPHQPALEYNRNRYEVIAEQEKAYKEFLDKIDQIQKDLQSTNKPPFLSHDVDKELNKVFTDVRYEVEESIKKYSDFLKADPIFEILSEIFDGKISEGFSQVDLLEIYKEGEIRYKSKIPPGFEDEKNKEGERKYGDLVLWEQIIKIATSLKKDMILITDERKIDWWWKKKDGRNMGPRQELVEEIKSQAGVNFHMYSSERFLSYGQTYLKEQIDQKALEEIQAMKRAELEAIKSELDAIKEFERANYLNRKRRVEKDDFELKNRLEKFQEQISLYNEHISSLREKEDLGIEDSSLLNKHIEQLRLKVTNLEEEKSKTLEEYYFNKEMFLEKRIKDDNPFYLRFKDI